MSDPVFQSLASLLGRIDRSISTMASAASEYSRDRSRIGSAEQLRSSLQGASSASAMIRDLKSILAQGLGGEAKSRIQDATRDYESSIRSVVAEKRRESEATRRFALAYAEAQRYLAVPGLPANVAQAIRAGTITPSVARGVGGLRFQGIAQQMVNARGKVQRAKTRRAGASQAARMAAARGRQAATGPRGLPQGGKLASLGKVAQSSGLGGIGTKIGGLVGGAPGAGIGALFDVVFKSATTIVNEFNKAINESVQLIGNLNRLSAGALQAYVTLQIAELRKNLYIANQLGDSMNEFANIQSKNINAWKEWDVFVANFRLMFAKIGSVVEGFVGKFAGHFVKSFGLEQHPERVFGPIGIGVAKIYSLLNEWFGWTTKEKPDVNNAGAGRKLFPWENAFQQQGEPWKAARLGGHGQPWRARDFQDAQKRQQRAGLPRMPRVGGLRPGVGGPAGMFPQVPPPRPAMPGRLQPIPPGGPGAAGKPVPQAAPQPGGANGQPGAGPGDGFGNLIPPGGPRAANDDVNAGIGELAALMRRHLGGNVAPNGLTPVDFNMPWEKPVRAGLA